MNKSYFRAIHAIIVTGHWITDCVGRELKAEGFTEPQYNVMRTLKEASGGPISVRFIQDRMVQRTSNVTRILDKLLTKGLVERRECPSNRRKMDITLTQSGDEMLKKLDQKISHFHLPLIEKLDSEEFDLVRKLLKKLKS